MLENSARLASVGKIFSYITGSLFFGAALLVSACGTTYDLPKIGESETERAAIIFAEEQALSSSAAAKSKSTSAMVAQYKRVVSRVEPIAENFCKTQKVDKKGFDCDVVIGVDPDMTERNAYQSYADAGKPILVFSVPIIADARSDDELAFILGHEFGHHIAEHLNKLEQQALTGAILMGALTAYGQAYDPNPSSYENQLEMERNVAAGYAIGHKAFSQSYELEADVIGTYIAEAAGYDPVEGARFFARPEPVRSENGALSFWGTHPPDEKRLATVISTADKIERQRAGSP